VKGVNQPPKEDQSDVDVQQLARRVEQLENERPFSTAETLARWSTVSGGLTLSHHPSEGLS